MADPLIPQSAAPLGQAPFAGIRPVNTTPSIPGVMDTSSLYQSLGSINQAYNNMLNKKQLDLMEQKQNFDMLDKQLQRVQDMFKDAHALSKTANGQTNGLPLLNGNYAGTSRVNQELKGATQTYNERVSQIMRQFNQNQGVYSPQQISMLAQGIQDAQAEYYAELNGNEDYVRFSRAEKAYQDTLDKIQEGLTDNTALNVAKFNDFVKKHEAYMNEAPGAVMREADYVIDDFIFDKTKATAAIASISEELKQGRTVQERKRDELGREYVENRTEYFTEDEVVQRAMASGQISPDLRKMAEASVASGVHKDLPSFYRDAFRHIMKRDELELGKVEFDQREFNQRERLGSIRATRPNNVGTGDQASKQVRENNTYTWFLDNDARVADAIREKFGSLSPDSKSTPTIVAAFKSVANKVGQMGYNPESITNMSVLTGDLPKSTRYVINNRGELEVLDRNGNMIAVATQRFDDYDTHSNILRVGAPGSPVQLKAPDGYLERVSEEGVNLTASSAIRDRAYTVENKLLALGSPEAQAIAKEIRELTDEWMSAKDGAHKKRQVIEGKIVSALSRGDSVLRKARTKQPSATQPTESQGISPAKKTAADL